MPDRKYAFMRVNSPKMGDDAAEYYWKVVNLKALLIPYLFVGLLALVLNDPLIPFIVMIVMGVPTIAAVLVYRRRGAAATARALGIKIGLSSGPPRRDDEYRRWCDKVGLEPYSAPNRFGAGEPPFLQTKGPKADSEGSE